MTGLCGSDAWVIFQAISEQGEMYSHVKIPGRVYRFQVVKRQSIIFDGK